MIVPHVRAELLSLSPKIADSLAKDHSPLARAPPNSLTPKSSTSFRSVQPSANKLIQSPIVTMTSTTASTTTQRTTRSQVSALPRRRRVRSQSPVRPNGDDTDPLPKPETIKRASSYPDCSNTSNSLRIRIQYQDEALRVRSQENAKQLLQSAVCAERSSTATSNNSILARRALKYRNVLDRMTGVDVNDPTFDASAFLGVHWCKSKCTTTTPRALPRKNYVIRQM